MHFHMTNTNMILLILGSSGQMEKASPKAKPAAKVGLAGPRLRAAPIVKRKRRAAVDSDDDN
jgi:hypothetical protein